MNERISCWAARLGLSPRQREQPFAAPEFQAMVETPHASSPQPVLSSDSCRHQDRAEVCHQEQDEAEELPAGVQPDRLARLQPVHHQSPGRALRDGGQLRVRTRICPRRGPFRHHPTAGKAAGAAPSPPITVPDQPQLCQSVCQFNKLSLGLDPRVSAIFSPSSLLCFFCSISSRCA